MGKAYTEEERLAIRKRIWEEALDMFHDGRSKTLNIRELTERTGISLGSFYRFYKDKKSLINDIIEYRVNQKLELLKATFPESEKDPAGYLTELLYSTALDMGRKLQNREIYKEMLEVAFGGDEDEMNQFLNVYLRFLKELKRYWQERQVACEMDEEGIMSLIRGISSYYDASKYIRSEYFEELLRVFIIGGVQQYVKTDAGDIAGTVGASEVVDTAENVDAVETVDTVAEYSEGRGQL